MAEARLDLIFLDRVDGRGVPMTKGPAAMIQYSAYGTPLWEDQLRKLAQDMGK